jgi:hypothetical protein
MNAPLHRQVVVEAEVPSQEELPLASEGVQCYLWRGAFGSMLIEVKDGVAYVNGSPVELLRETLRKNA